MKKFTIGNNFSGRLADLIKTRCNGKQSEFCEITGISQSYISQILSGKKGPSADLIASLVVNFGDSIRWLITGAGQMRPAQVKHGHGFITEQVQGWLPDDEQRLLDAWRHASDEIRRAALTMLENSAKEFQAGGGEGESSQAQNSA
jgi:transcriptional regulator with XRE-family HTH domain